MKLAALLTLPSAAIAAVLAVGAVATGVHLPPGQDPEIIVRAIGVVKSITTERQSSLSAAGITTTNHVYLLVERRIDRGLAQRIRFECLGAQRDACLRQEPRARIEVLGTYPSVGDVERQVPVVRSIEALE